MWLYTSVGFFSIVRNTRTHKESAALVVRARVRSDLEKLRRIVPGMSPIEEHFAKDYSFRCYVSRQIFADMLSRLVFHLQYRNFKEEVKRIQGKRRHDIYERVWRATLELEGQA